MASKDPDRTRRRVLATLAGLGTVSIAGCTSDTDGSGGNTKNDSTANTTTSSDITTSSSGPKTDGVTSSNTGTSSTSEAATSAGLGEAVEPVWDIPSQQGVLPSDATFHLGHFNVATSNYGVAALTLTPYGRNPYSPDGEYVPMLMSKCHLIENNSVWEVQMSDKDFTWHNGKPVTIEDYYNVARYELESTRALGNNSAFTEVKKVDDRTVHHVLQEPTHPGVFFAGRKANVNLPRWHTQKWLKQMKNASSVKDVEQIRAELNKQTRSIDEYVGHGLFEISDWSDQEYILTKYEDHPFADQQNIEKIKMHVYGGKAAKRLAWENGNLDAGSVPITGKTKLPSKLEEIKHPHTGTTMMIYNQYHKDLTKRAVRQALAYLIDQKAIVNNFNDKYAADPYNGLPDPVNERFFDDWNSRKKKYLQYGPEGKPEKAAAILKDAGYSKENGTWIDSDGKPFKLKIEGKDWYSVSIKTLVSQFNRFGISADFEFSGDTYWTQLAEPKGNWDAMLTASPKRSPYPPVYFKNAPRGLQILLKTENEDPRHYANRPRKVTIPKKMGVRTANGSGRELDLVKLLKEFRSPSLSSKRFNELLDTLTNYWNIDQPAIRFAGRLQGGTFDTENFVYQDFQDDDKLKLHSNMAPGAITIGKWHGKTK